jgi:prepilin-type N-terminal cleavage/methylation domain-containing protein
MMPITGGWKPGGQRGVTLVELLVVLVIMTIVSTMILGVWFTLSRSYANTSESSQQRDDAQLAMERLTREIRDAQATTASDGAAISATNLGPYCVRINTSFNTSDADNPTTVPRLVQFRLQDGVLYRQTAGPDRVFGTSDDANTVMIRDVVNASTTTDLFTYYYYNGTGDLVHSSGTSALPANTLRVKAIKVTLLVDLNPGRSPEYMKLVNMVQPRNQRSF